MSVETLYPMVSAAIQRAEDLEDRGAPGSKEAFLDVSRLEEQIAETLPASDPEGALARRGAVRAALSAHDPARARQLIDRYLADTECDQQLRSDLLGFSERVEAVGAARALR